MNGIWIADVAGLKPSIIRRGSPEPPSGQCTPVLLTSPVAPGLRPVAEACVQIRESEPRGLRHQQDIALLSGALAVDVYDDNRSARERRSLNEALAPLLDDAAHEAWVGASG